MEISLKTIEIARLGKDGLICQDNIRADIKVTFFLRVNKTAEDVLKVAQAVGCARASNQDTLESLFSAKFAEALKTVGKGMDFVELYQARDRFRDSIIRQIGDDLSGYVLEDAAIDYIEQTPLDKLDGHNILDAQGIKKITELTAIENIRTNELKRDEEMRIKKKNVETREAILELERQQADAESRQGREVSSVRAREQAETQKVAEQEEAIKEVRVVAEADRQKKSVVITAEAAAEEKMVLTVKAAEAEERSAKHKAAQELTLADARLKVAEKAAEAKKREAEGREAELAAPGLADAKVRIASAEAILKQGAAQAESTRMQMEAEAKGKEQLGRADAQVRIAGAEATAKQGAADAEALRLHMHAEAQGTEQMGLAAAAVKSADADATAKHGDAEAQVIQARFEAESKGLAQKFEAMSAMSADTRAHEEFRMQLEIGNQQIIKGIEAQTHIAKDQAEVLGKALQNARIDIVGGEGDYFERFVNALAIGKGIDATIDKSKTLQIGLKDHLSGERDMVNDIRGMIGALGGASAELQNLTVAALLAKVSREGTVQQQSTLHSLLASFKPGVDAPKLP